jgi:hypothetical protein
VRIDAVLRPSVRGRAVTGAALTRRAILKRGAIGAAAAWGVPLVASSTASAAVPSGTCLSRAIEDGGPACAACPDLGRCGGTPGHQGCACFVDVKGCCFCANCDACKKVVKRPCRKKRDCPSGWACVYTCCSTTETYCMPPCGYQVTQPISGPGGSCQAPPS